MKRQLASFVALALSGCSGGGDSSMPAVVVSPPPQDVVSRPADDFAYSDSPPLPGGAAVVTPWHMTNVRVDLDGVGDDKAGARRMSSCRSQASLPGMRALLIRDEDFYVAGAVWTELASEERVAESLWVNKEKHYGGRRESLCS